MAVVGLAARARPAGCCNWLAAGLLLGGVFGRRPGTPPVSGGALIALTAHLWQQRLSAWLQTKLSTLPPAPAHKRYILAGWMPLTLPRFPRTLMLFLSCSLYVCNLKILSHQSVMNLLRPPDPSMAGWLGSWAAQVMADDALGCGDMRGSSSCSRSGEGAESAESGESPGGALALPSANPHSSDFPQCLQ